MVKAGDKIKITKIKRNVETWNDDGVFNGEIYEIIDIKSGKNLANTTMWFRSDGINWCCFIEGDEDFEYEIVGEFEIVSNDIKDKATKHKKICEQLNKIYVSKNHDYGDSFGETYKKLGIISAVTRITDKVNRLQSLCTKEQKVKDESIEDTLMDLANYAVMTLIELKEGEK